METNPPHQCFCLLAGDYNLPDDIILSVPVTFKDGQWSLLRDVSVREELKERLELSARELSQEKEPKDINI